MFRWFKRSGALPPLSAANPGDGAWVRTAFADGKRSWTEEASVA